MVAEEKEELELLRIQQLQMEKEAAKEKMIAMQEDGKEFTPRKGSQEGHGLHKSTESLN